MDQLPESILKKLSDKVDHVEVYMEREESTDVDILNDKINHAKEENIIGLGIRVIKDQKQGFASTTNLNRIDETINHAIESWTKTRPNL